MNRVHGIGWLRTSGLMIAFALAALAFLGSHGIARAQDSASVDIVDFAFDSDSVTIDAGGTVTWTNTGDASHTVTADDGSFDSGTLASGDTYSFTFDEPGTYTYHCNIHSSMTATIVVVAADSGDDTSGDDTSGDTTTDTSGDATLPSTGVGSSIGGQGVPTILYAGVAVLLAAGLIARRRSTAS